ncbi:hypothetical protein C8J56DRAFT_1048478 [Mycena floridula]|nr:hypothetical protein C8J56DRAFT_1048478 [Mycena floridula]
MSRGSLLNPRPTRPCFDSDLLRMMVEYTARTDRPTALSLARVSRQIQQWQVAEKCVSKEKLTGFRRTDPILYCEVVLRRNSMSQAFLRTLQNAAKPTGFFEQHVISLSISVEYQDNIAAQILSVCRGVTNLTLWTVACPNVNRHSVLAVEAAVTRLRPTKLSAYLHHILRAPNPRFQLPFFQDITHLTITNHLEDWTSWSEFECLQALTHVSFDVRVGPQGLSIAQSIKISQTVAYILNERPLLQIVVLQLMFDQSPTSTKARIISFLGGHNPKLVFIHNKDPFRHRDAHSNEAQKTWELAHGAVGTRGERYFSR